MFGGKQEEEAIVDSESKDRLSTKVGLLFLDKLVLALLLAGAGFIFNSILQQEKIRGDSQKKIFEERVNSYLAILQQAKESRDYLALLYLPGERLGEIGRREQLERLVQRVENISSGRGGGGSSTFGTYDKAFEPLIAIEKIMRENDVYISDDVRAAAGAYLDIVVGDLEKQIARLEEESRRPERHADKQWYESHRKIDRAAWERADAGYQRLRNEIYQKLAVEKLPIG